MCRPEALPDMMRPLKNVQFRSLRLSVQSAGKTRMGDFEVAIRDNLQLIGVLILDAIAMRLQGKTLSWQKNRNT